MKYLAIIPLLLAASCASHPQPQVVVRPLPPPAVEPVEGIRYAEVVRAYHVGRYVDPNQPLTMYEQHPVYRIEAVAQWNLHPGPLWPAATNLLNPPHDAAFAPPPVNDAVVAEIGRQREATDQVIHEARRLAQSHEEFQGVIQQMQTVGTNQRQLRARLADTEQRMAEFAKELQKLAALATAPATNDVPTANPEATTPGP